MSAFINEIMGVRYHIGTINRGRYCVENKMNRLSNSIGLLLTCGMWKSNEI